MALAKFPMFNSHVWLVAAILSGLSEITPPPPPPQNILVADTGLISFSPHSTHGTRWPEFVFPVSLSELPIQSPLPEYSFFLLNSPFHLSRFSSVLPAFTLCALCSALGLFLFLFQIYLAETVTFTIRVI